MPREYKVHAPPRMRPPHPGAILRRDVLPALDVNVTAAARALGVSRQLLHGILAERLSVSPETAERLGQWCGNDSYLWLALQRDFDLWQVKQRQDIKVVPAAKVAA